MISAFGVEHGYISKSLSGKTFKPITAMTGKQRAKIPGSHAKLGGPNRGDKAWQKKHTGYVKQMKEAVDLQGGNGIRGNDPFGVVGGGTYREGGKKTGKSHVVGAAPNKGMRQFIGDHEAAHANVKRSSYRLHRQIASNPEKLMREEARADYTSGGHYDQHPPGAGSSYATAARAQVQAEKRPNHPSKGSKKAAEFWGEGSPRLNNKQAYHGAKSMVTQSLPHYDLFGEKGDKAVGAYRGLHDSMKAKGVPQPKKRRLRMS